VVKEFLSHEGVAFTVFDLNTDAAARDEFLRRGYRLPPVVVINGTAVEGFQPERIEQLLDEAEQAGSDEPA
jgi:glutaredoxin 3